MITSHHKIYLQENIGSGGLFKQDNRLLSQYLQGLCDHQVKYILNIYPYLRYPSHRHQWGWLTTSSERNQSFRKKFFNWTISKQYTQQYYYLFQTFNMPWRRGTARISRGLPNPITRLIRITYSAIYWHLCFTCLLQKITVVDRHVAPRHLLLSQDLNLLLGN